MNDLNYDLNFENLNLDRSEQEDLLLILLGYIDRYYIMEVFRQYDIPGRTRLHKELGGLPYVGWWSRNNDEDKNRREEYRGHIQQILTHTNIYDWLRLIANRYEFGRIGACLGKANIRRKDITLRMSVRRNAEDLNPAMEENQYNRSDYDFGG